jgi:TRAP-type C4-dicarboxylate transport system permease small subunit
MMPDDRSRAGIPSPIRALRSLLTRPVEWACGLLMAAITGVVFLQVITRYVLAYPFDWPEELARILFVWVALLGAVLAFRKAGHFSIEAFTNLLPSPLRRGFSVLLRVTLLGFLLFVAYLGLDATLRVREQLSTAMEISMSYGYASVPVSFALMALEMASALWRDLREAPQ